MHIFFKFNKPLNSIKIGCICPLSGKLLLFTKIFYNSWCTWSFSLCFNVHVQHIRTQECVLRKCQESFETAIEKNIRKFQYWSKTAFETFIQSKTSIKSNKEHTIDTRGRLKGNFLNQWKVCKLNSPLNAKLLKVFL